MLTLSSCKKDDNPVGTGGGSGLPTLNFADPSPSVAIPSGTASARVVLAGGIQPYGIQTAPDPAVATVIVSHDSITITVVGPGSTSVTIHDSSPRQEESGSVNLVTIGIIVNGEGGGEGGSPFDFPLPDIAGVDGAIGVVHLNSAAYGDFDYAIGVFEGATANSFVYGGAVSVNSNAVDSMIFGSNVFYLGFLSTGAVSFDNSSTTSFSVTGAGSVPAFNGSIIAPVISQLTAPANNATVPTSSSLSVTWDGTGADSIVVVVANASNGKSISKQGLPNSGSYSVSAVEMATLGAGQGIVHVVKYRYNLVTAGSKQYVILAESDSFAFVTLN